MSLNDPTLFEAEGAPVKHVKWEATSWTRPSEMVFYCILFHLLCSFIILSPDGDIAFN